jgi:hypothetical protein
MEGLGAISPWSPEMPVVHMERNPFQAREQCGLVETISVYSDSKLDDGRFGDYPSIELRIRVHVGQAGRTP